MRRDVQIETYIADLIRRASIAALERRIQFSANYADYRRLKNLTSENLRNLWTKSRPPPSAAASFCARGQVVVVDLAAVEAFSFGILRSFALESPGSRYLFGMRHKCLCSRRMLWLELSRGICARELTHGRNALFCTSRWKRDSSNPGVRSTYIWDCKLDSILSRHDYRQPATAGRLKLWSGTRLSFFVV